MGTWGANILENDTSSEVYDDFFKHYHNGYEIETILTKIDYLDEYLEDRYAKYNCLFALYLAKWETNLLTEKDISDFELIIIEKNYLSISEELGASKDFLEKHQKHAENLFKKVKKPTVKPKKRKHKTPVSEPKKIDLKFKSGTCLSFKLKNNKYGGAIILEHEFYDSEGSFVFAYTTIEQDHEPSITDFLNSSFQDTEIYDQETYECFGGNYIASVFGENIFYKTEKNGVKMEKVILETFSIIGEIEPIKFLRITSSTNFLKYNYKLETVVNNLKSKIEKDIKSLKGLDFEFRDIPNKTLIKDYKNIIRKRKNL